MRVSEKIFLCSGMFYFIFLRFKYSMLMIGLTKVHNNYLSILRNLFESSVDSSQTPSALWTFHYLWPPLFLRRSQLVIMLFPCV